ncbi:MAG: 50S ribosomal protein L9 [Candidatus Ancillula sp.]|jgi:large subunit ribosomal protein L9|nr:50S ribosomal protein L9 [Candidatus Ancillula sp.]
MANNKTKVILNQTVAKLGLAGDTVEVQPGFARNYLLPRAIAAPWSKKAEEQVASHKALLRKKAIESIEAASELKGKLEAVTILVPAKVGKADANGVARLFGAIKGANVAEAIKKQIGVDVDKRSIEVNGVVKTTGPAKAVAHLFEGAVAQLKLNVVASSK